MTVSKQKKNWLEVAKNAPPKDGKIIRIGWAFDDGDEIEEWFIMGWGHIHQNGLFPGKVGMWVSPCGSFTWIDTDPDGAPTHWQELADEKKSYWRQTNEPYSRQCN